MKRKIVLLFSVFMILLFYPENLYITAGASEIYPERFDLRDFGIIHEPDAQGDFNTCWAFSMLGSVHSNIQKSVKCPLFSEWYLVYSAYTGNYRFPANSSSSEVNGIFSEGGSASIASAVLTGWRGFADRKDVPYGSPVEAINIFNIKKTSYGKTRPDYIINDISNLAPWVSDKKKCSKELIKELIYSKNSVVSTCSLSPEYFSAENAALCSKTSNYKYKKDPFYHSVLLIGWDDGYPRENFTGKCTPDEDGAWIAKNSYGTEWGKGGYFYISYEDTSLLEAVSCTNASENEYSNIYQYDEYGWAASFPSNIISDIISGKRTQPSDTGYMANIFQASSDEIISAVSFYTTEENAEYEVRIFTDISDNSDPVSGKLKTCVSGIQKYTGYHTVKLDKEIFVGKGEYFSAVVKIKNPSSSFTVPAEACVMMYDKENSLIISNIRSMNKKIHKNESFISSDGENWNDMFISNDGETPGIIRSASAAELLPSLPEDENLAGIVCGNVCLKVFTKKYAPSGYDINGNGVVSASDMSALAKIILNGAYNSISDIDGDGAVTASDLLLLKKYLLSS